MVLVECTFKCFLEEKLTSNFVPGLIGPSLNLSAFIGVFSGCSVSPNTSWYRLGDLPEPWERIQLQQAFSNQNTIWKIYFPKVVKNQVFSAVSLLRTFLFWGILEHLFQNGICGCLQCAEELEWGFMDRSLLLLVLPRSVRKCSVSAAENPKPGITGQAGRDVPAPPAPSAPVGSCLSHLWCPGSAVVTGMALAMRRNHFYWSALGCGWNF